MPRKSHKFHYIYKTICAVTNRFYYGMHSTSNLEDGYIGSGTILWHSINKYGRDNHYIEILEYYDNRKILKIKEKEIITEDLLNDPMCMNLQPGGGGGFKNNEHQLKCSTAGGKSFSKHLEEDPEFKEYWSKTISQSNASLNRGFLKDPYNWTNKKHSEETKKKMSEADRTGIKNSQYGTMWITNGSINKKIKKSDSIPSGWKAGRNIR